MKELQASLISALLFLVGCSQQPSSDFATSDVADTIYTNGNIYTVNDAQPWAEAVAIKDGSFLVVGSTADVEAVAGESTEVIDLGGKFVMPGLIDVHVHPLTVARDRSGVAVSDPTEPEAILRDVAAFAAANPDAPAIRGGEWNIGGVFPGDSPRKELLDEIDADRPIYLMSQTGHSAWVNSKALELAGIDHNTPNGGRFVFDVDPETGEPSGTVREYAMGAVTQAMPKIAAETFASHMEEIVQLFQSHGYTALKPAEGEANIVEAARLAQSGGNADMRLFPAWHWRTHYSDYSPDEEDASIAAWETFRTKLIYPRHVKLFYDGGPDSYTAVMEEPYLGQPDNSGQPHFPKEEMLATITELNAKGIGVLVHVLGDRGASEVVDIFEAVREKNGDNGAPLHLSHAWQMRKPDMDRLAALEDVCIDFSPALNYRNPVIVESFVPPLGEERYGQFFAVRDAYESGLPVGFGSDWAASLIPEPNAFHHIQTWVTRVNPEQPDSAPLNPDQGVTLEQAVRGYTLGGAECLGFGWEDKLGSIEEGKLADFIVLDRNVFEIPIEEVFRTQVERTVLGGRAVFERN